MDEDFRCQCGHLASMHENQEECCFCTVEGCHCFDFQEPDDIDYPDDDPGFDPMFLLLF